MAIYGLPESGVLTFEKAAGEDKIYLGPRRQTWIIELSGVQSAPIWIRVDGGAADQGDSSSYMLAIQNGREEIVEVPVEGHISLYVEGNPGGQGWLTIRKIGVKY